MSTLAVGSLYGASTLIVMFLGVPVAFALGAVAIAFMMLFMPSSALDTVTQNVYEEMGSITLLSIPLFILKGAAIGKSRAASDLYAAIHRWLQSRARRPGHRQRARVRDVRGDGRLEPGDLLGGRQRRHPRDAPARLLGWFRRRPDRRGRHAGDPAAAVDHDDPLRRRRAGVAGAALSRRHRAGAAAGRPASPATRRSTTGARRAPRAASSSRAARARPISTTSASTSATSCARLPRALPFVVLLLGVMVALYGGYATASETAGLGAVLALLLILIVYRMWRPRDLAPVFAGTLKESTMLMFIIGMSVLYAYVMSYLHISQSAAEWIVALALPRWALLAATLLLVVALGFFLPPVSIILMTAPIVLPPLKAAGFDLVWFGVVMTVVMEMGLIHPPVGLNIFVIRNIAPDIPLSQIIRGVVPLLALMIAAVVLMSVFPRIATALPDAVMGPGCRPLDTGAAAPYAFCCREAKMVAGRGRVARGRRADAVGGRRRGALRYSGWKRIPAVTVVSAPGDPRIPAVREAIAHWNQTFAELGTPFRLGAITLVNGSVPDQRPARALRGRSCTTCWRVTLAREHGSVPGRPARRAVRRQLHLVRRARQPAHAGRHQERRALSLTRPTSCAT